MTGIETLFAAGAASGAAAGGAAAAGAAGGLASVGMAVTPTLAAAATPALVGASVTPALSLGAAGAGAGLFSASNMLMASTALGLVSSLSQGAQAANAAEKQAAQYELQAQMERTEAATREEARQRQLNETLAAQRVVWGARGVDLASGTARTAAEKAESQARRETDIDRAMTGVNVASARGAARASRGRASGALWGGVAGAGGSLLDYAMTRANLGTV